MRLIDADELMKKVKKWLPPDPCERKEKEFPFETDICVSMLMEIEEAPTAADLVRCRECKHCIASRQGKLFCIRGFEQTIISAFAAIDNPIFEREFDSFCSYGEQR